MNKRNQTLKKGVRLTKRLIDSRELVPRFLIVCEGERTEPNYFRGFRVPKDVISVGIVGTGYNTISLVQYAIRLRQQDEYDQVWCVFDRDSFPAQNFNNALSLARQNDIHVAYSNEAFELWYLLHFNYYQTAISRADYIVRLNFLLERSYQKNSPDIYILLENRQSVAIQNAKRLLTLYNPCQPSQDNPSTTVHLLVEELWKYSR